jgi:photosystem II stability/assembly factor-like uncharacterized protein
MNIQKLHSSLIIAATTLAISFGTTNSISAAETNVSALTRDTDFHGIAVDANNSSRIYLATHHGLFVVAPNGDVDRVSDMRADFMGFTPHPTNSNIFYASGHPSVGGNLGFITSIDGGKTWNKLSDGIGGPVDFHQMDVSKVNPNIIIGNAGGLQMSKDGGHTWNMVGPVPRGTIDLAASALNENTLYAATQSGIARSKDAGKSWSIAHTLGRTTTMIDVAADGMLYAFMIGTGLIRTTEPGLSWQLVSNNLGDKLILHLAVDPSNQQKMYAITFIQQTRKLSIIASDDGGANWKTLGQD